ncbi:MAG TPA: thiamine pyrophosphate-binding protein [Pseudolysinimonas sp.]|nr:thiamine pyrophosphate-binding protein [Pseudolysinimonas sp.]
MPTVSAQIALALADHVEQVFGVMGNGNAYLMDAFEHLPGVTVTPVRHEAGAIVAADAFHRASGSLAVATATYGAGFTNMLTPLAESVQARIPMIVVVGDQPTTGARPWDVDQGMLATAVGARTFTVGADTATETAIDAIEYALSQRTPVVLTIPYDLATAEVGSSTTRELTLPGPVIPDSAAVEALVEAVASAKRPYLLGGRGAWVAGAGTALGEVADLTGAITGSTALGRGLFPRGEFDLGVTGGFGAEAAMALVAQADVAVVFGAALNQFTTKFGELFGEQTVVIQVDVSDVQTNPRVDRFIRGDASVVAAAVVVGLRTRGATPSGWRESMPIAKLRQYETGTGIAPDGRLDPRSVAERIAELLPDDRVVVTDGGHFLGWVNMFWPVAAPDRMMTIGTAYQSIGLGFSSVAGAARAQPESTIVLATGDGGGLMALADLETAVRVAAGHGIAVVWNDAAYGAEVTLYGRVKGLALAPMLIPEVDFAALGEAVGAEGVVVRTLADLDRLGAWAAEPADSRRFLVLDCRISGGIVAPYQQEIIRVNS